MLKVLNENRILDAAETLVTLHHNSDNQTAVKPSAKLVHIHKRDIDSFDSQNHLTITGPQHSIGKLKLTVIFQYFYTRQKL